MHLKSILYLVLAEFWATTACCSLAGAPDVFRYSNGDLTSNLANVHFSTTIVS
jgi:hypothetical protein